MLLSLLFGTALAWDVNSNDWTDDLAPVEEPFQLNTTSFGPVTSDQDLVEEGFVAALWTWNTESDADLFLTYGGRSLVTQQGGGNDDHNVGMYGGSTYGSGIAVATTNSSGGFLTDCDIRFYRSNLYGTVGWHFGEATAPSGVMDFRHTAIHESGHCLGMAHSDDSDAIMYGSNTSGTGDERRHLDDDDRGGIQFLYGAVEPLLVLGEHDTTLVASVGEVNVWTGTVQNEGDGSAFYVVSRMEQVNGPAWSGLSSADRDLGHIGAPTPVGGAVGPASALVDLEFDVPSDCVGDNSLDLDLVLEDAAGQVWREPVSLVVSCGSADPDPEGEERVAGCACSAGGHGGVGLWWTLGLLGIAARRRR